MSDFSMPSLGADMEFGTLLEWRVQPGDAVKRGDIVAVVDTSKAEIEVEIFEDGVIEELLVEEGAKRVPVGTVLARVRPAAAATDRPTAQPETPEATTPAAAAGPSAAAPAAAESTRAAPAPAEPTGPPPAADAAPQPPAVPVRPPAEPVAHEHRVRVSPLARRTAERLGVDLRSVTGTGSGGAITREDVTRALGESQPRAELERVPEAERPGEPEPEPERSAEQSAVASREAAMRQAIGALMARSKREIPHYYLQTPIDLSETMSWLERENFARPVERRLLPSVVLLAAAARAAGQFPAMNGFWLEDQLHNSERVHVGVAISLRGGGVIAPAVHDADRRSLDELMEAVRDLVSRARTGRLRSSEMSDPTITVTNLGEGGVELVHGVIYPPQVALVGFGGVCERPWAQDGMLGVRPVVQATLAADHRASDGHAGSRFLQRIERELQHPEEL